MIRRKLENTHIFVDKPTYLIMQTLLRQSDVRLTLQFYTHAISDDRMSATGAMLGAILNPCRAQKRTESGLRENAA